MSLVQLTDENVKLLINKDVYCVEKSITYLQELKENFPDVIVRGVFDGNRRNQGTFLFEEEILWVKSLPEILSVDISKSVFLITGDYFVESYRIISQYIGEEIDVYFWANKETEYDLMYRRKYDAYSLEDICLFRSGPHASAYVYGMDFADNARALFEYMLKLQLNKKWKLVWFVKNPEDYSSYTDEYENVFFVAYDWSVSESKEERDLYYHYLCLAKYIFMTDAYGFCRNARKDQIRMQLWHGCGFKTRTNFVRCEYRYDFTTVISDLYKEIHKEVYGLRDDQVLVTGYPKEDWLFEQRSGGILERLEICRRNKLLIWLPTFRKAHSCLSNLDESEIVSETELPIIDSYEKMNKLNEILIRKDSTLVIKLHPFQKKSHFDSSMLSNIILLDNEKLIKEDIQVNELLGLADALISDYSSGAVDYLILDRPIAFTLDDVKEYSDSRGFVFDNILEWLPGKEIWSDKDFYEYIEEIGDGLDLCQQKRRKIKSKMHKFNDGNSSKRVLEALGISTD